jgi:CHAD domain-containing protein
MEQSVFILQHWDEQRIVFMNNLEFVRQRPARKVAHDMRVSIKKLRSYLQLCNEINDKEDKQEFDSISLLFRVAGKYRDVEMSIILSQRHLKKDKVCVPFFVKNLRALFKQVRNRTNETAKAPHEEELERLSKWMHESLRKTPDKELAKKIETLVVKKIEELKKLINQFTENGHEIRKLLKQLYYWVKYCSPEPILNQKEINILDRALICLGNAQDYFVLQNKLKDFRKEYLVKATEEYASAKKLEKICKDSQEQLMKKAKEKTEQLLKRFEKS